MGFAPYPQTTYIQTQVRICTEAYEAPTANNIDKTTMHLTNYSVNKVLGFMG